MRCRVADGPGKSFWKQRSNHGQEARCSLRCSISKIKIIPPRSYWNTLCEPRLSSGFTQGSASLGPTMLPGRLQSVDRWGGHLGDWLPISTVSKCDEKTSPKVLGGQLGGQNSQPCFKHQISADAQVACRSKEAGVSWLLLGTRKSGMGLDGRLDGVGSWQSQNMSGNQTWQAGKSSKNPWRLYYRNSI